MRISIKLTEAVRDARVTVVTDSGREDGEWLSWHVLLCHTMRRLPLVCYWWKQEKNDHQVKINEQHRINNDTNHFDQRKMPKAVKKLLRLYTLDMGHFLYQLHSYTDPKLTLLALNYRHQDKQILFNYCFRGYIASVLSTVKLKHVVTSMLISSRSLHNT